MQMMEVAAPMMKVKAAQGAPKESTAIQMTKPKTTEKQPMILYS